MRPANSTIADQGTQEDMAHLVRQDMCENVGWQARSDTDQRGGHAATPRRPALNPGFAELFGWMARHKTQLEADARERGVQLKNGRLDERAQVCSLRDFNYRGMGGAV